MIELKEKTLKQVCEEEKSKLISLITAAETQAEKQTYKKMLKEKFPELKYFKVS